VGDYRQAALEHGRRRYKHIVLGLIFLKYVSDAFTERRDELARRFSDPADECFIEDEELRLTDLEQRDYYTEASVFWVLEEARWDRIRDQAKQPTIGKIIDDALVAIESENPRLKGILDKRFARTQLEPGRLGELVDLISRIGFTDEGHRAKDMLGQVYEYFLGQFANAEGKKGRTVLYARVGGARPRRSARAAQGKVYDPCCGSGGCSCSLKSSSRVTAAGSATSRFTGRSRIRRRGGSLP
jgi:type I restriction enzyme M protein